MIAKTLLSLHLVAVGDGNVVHLVAEAQDEHILGVSPGRRHALPYRYALLRPGVGPMAHHHLAAKTHTGADVAELTVAMRALV